MAKSLIERLRAGRQQQVTSLDMKFTIRRPNDIEWAEWRSSGSKVSGILKFVCGWGEMTEISLGIPGGTGAVVPFDHEIYMEWIADHPEHWDTLTSAVIDAYKKHDEATGELIKNSKPGS